MEADSKREGPVSAMVKRSESIFSEDIPVRLFTVLETARILKIREAAVRGCHLRNVELGRFFRDIELNLKKLCTAATAL